MQVHPAGARILARNPGLRQRLAAGRREYRTVGGDVQLVWSPDFARVERIVVKNARGHAMHELGEPMLDAPSSVAVYPIQALTVSEREAFEDAGFGNGWPEVGSRMLTRLVTDQDMHGGWVVVQDAIYRYAVNQEGGVAVRSVIHEYLATKVIWSD